MQVKIKKKFPETTTLKISENNYSFHLKWCTMGKVSFLFFKSFLLVVTKPSCWDGHWALGYHSMEFRKLIDIS